MNTKERFQRTMHFQPVDKVPIIEVGCWASTLDRWIKEGMPEDKALKQSTTIFSAAITFNGNDFFGLDKQLCIDFNLGMIPGFKEEILKEDELTETFRDVNGVVKKKMKDNSSVPQFISFPVQNRKDFEKIKKNYDYKNPERYPKNWKEIIKLTKASDCPVWGPSISAVGLYSMLRTWMGTENACTIFYDDPALAHDMVDFIADFVIEIMKSVLKEVKLDYYMWWEDFSFKNGPLISPKIFKEFLMPRYRKVNDVFKSHGIDIIFFDTDGDPRALIPLIIECGINCFYPVEQCNDYMNPVVLRKEYGKDLLLWGGIDKRILAKTKKDIEKELYSKLPTLIEEGGYIPQLDHLAPPDVPYNNWLYYLELKRKLCIGQYG